MGNPDHLQDLHTFHTHLRRLREQAEAVSEQEAALLAQIARDLVP